MMVTVHNSFTLEQLCRAIEANGSMTMVTGDDYDVAGVFRLLRKAIELSMESVDVGYLEGRCFMDYMKERGALSPETAVDLAGAGLKNPNAMNVFLHSKKVGRTADGLFYLLDPKKKAEPEQSDRSFRVISNQVRFGCGYRTVDGRRQYFAWHGYPNRNDDFFTTAEISAAEFRQIALEYPKEISADRETAEVFRNKYVDRHPVILEGWNKLL